MVEPTNPLTVKTPVVVRPNYVMYLELYEGYLWFHTDIHKWSKEIKREYKKDLNTLQSLLPLPLVALVQEENKKLAKFGDCLNFKKVNSIMLKDKTTAFIYAYERTQGE